MNFWFCIEFLFWLALYHSIIIVAKNVFIDVAVAQKVLNILTGSVALYYWLPLLKQLIDYLWLH